MFNMLLQVIDVGKYDNFLFDNLKIPGHKYVYPIDVA